MEDQAVMDRLSYFLAAKCGISSSTQLQVGSCLYHSLPVPTGLLSTCDDRCLSVSDWFKGRQRCLKIVDEISQALWRFWLQDYFICKGLITVMLSLSVHGFSSVLMRGEKPSCDQVQLGGWKAGHPDVPLAWHKSTYCFLTACISGIFYNLITNYMYVGRSSSYEPYQVAVCSRD